MKKGKTRKFLLALIVPVAMFLLTSCGGATGPLASPDIKIYLLDLTASGNVENQFRLIQDDLFTDMTSHSLGSQELGSGPALTKFFFVGTNSRALREFSLQDYQIPYELFTYISDENNDTRTKKFWRLLTEKYQNYISINLENRTNVSKDNCKEDFNEILTPTWSSEGVRNVYVSFMCRMAVYSLTNYADLNDYILEQSQPGVQKASDVFGAFSKISNQITKYRNAYPDSKIMVKLATDGDHNLGGSSPTNLRAQIMNSQDICSLADDLRTKYQLQDFKTDGNVSIDPRGIAAIVKGTGEYPAMLENFWSCFFTAS
jgi:hypothetical protein